MKKLIFTILIFGLTVNGYLYLRGLKPVPIPSFTVQQTRIARVVKTVDYSEMVFGDAGTNSPTVAVSAPAGSCTNSVNWGNLAADAETADDTAYVTITGNNFDSTEITDYLELSTYGFSVSGTITGIEVGVLGFTNAGGVGSTYTDVLLMTSTGVYEGDDKAGVNVLPVLDPGTTYQNFGGSADNWNATLTATEANATTFGVALCFTATANDTNIDIDHVKITLTYTPDASVPVKKQSELFF